MDIEELSKVVEMIKGLGDSATDGFVMWLWLQVFENVWGATAFCVFLVFVYVIARPLLQDLRRDSHAVRAMVELREELDCGISGPLIDSEIECVLSKVRRMKAGAKCPEKSCDGKLEYPSVEGCSCHISPPCSTCTNNVLTCDR